MLGKNMAGGLHDRRRVYDKRHEKEEIRAGDVVPGTPARILDNMWRGHVGCQNEPLTLLTSLGVK